MTQPNHVPLLEVTRGSIVESIIYGSIVIVDAQGRLVYSMGDPQTVTYLRSTAKPFQVLPFVEMGGPDTFNLTDEELAVMCASHSGTDRHVEVVSGIQAKIGVQESDLMCGVHPPFHDATAKAMLLHGDQPTPNRHNCSGKHTGMLAQARLRGLNIENYIDPHHPVQELIYQAFSEMVRVPLDEISFGTDGCSAPVFAVPMFNAAWGLARLCDPRDLPEKRAAACRRITHAMSSFPYMVAGPDRWDTLAMTAAKGRLVTKAGAEGYQGIGLLPGALGPDSPALGIAVKIADGDQGGRARPIVCSEIVRQIGALNEAEMEALRPVAARPQYNWRKVEVGEYRTTFHVHLNLA